MTKLFPRSMTGAVATGAALLALAAGVCGVQAASAADRPTPTLGSSDAPPPAVEDFRHPGADKILADRGIKLLRGNGHIMLSDCAKTPGEDPDDMLRVTARDKSDACFRVTGQSGWLSLDIPKVTGVRGNKYNTDVDMTVGTKEKKNYKIDKGKWTPVGEASDPQERDHTLVEIHSSK
ncbi:hypothetical protein ACFZB9_19415 [Kitasatospora sp. NPDC008050]|uniref:hypothetical protein n=1 Tax=Kitasatospora sp. NPDC008050 TaxID=3364021 RepID=UPI0036E8A090